MPQEIIYDDEYLQSLEALDEPDTSSEFDPDADDSLPPPPIEDGLYFGVFENGGVYDFDKKIWIPYRLARMEGRKYGEINVKATILKPDEPLVHEKHVWTGPYALDTRPDPKTNASKVSAAFRALTGKPIAGLPGLGHVKQLAEVLKGGPTGWFTVRNVLQDRDGKKAAKDNGITSKMPGFPKDVYGQKRIMALESAVSSNGKFTGVAIHPVTGNRVVSKPFIDKFKPMDFAPPVRGGK